MKKQEYKDILSSNGYINLGNVIDFLEQNCIADFEAIAEIYQNGMSVLDYHYLQVAIEEVKEELTKEEMINNDNKNQ